MRTSFHHQPEAQHPIFQLSTSWQADYPIFWHKADMPERRSNVRFRAAGSTGHCNTARSLSAGVSKPKVFRGREILSQQAVGVLVAAALPRTAWIAEIDLHVGGDGEVLVVSHLLASIPGQGATQLLGQFAHVFT